MCIRDSDCDIIVDLQGDCQDAYGSTRINGSQVANVTQGINTYTQSQNGDYTVELISLGLTDCQSINETVTLDNCNVNTCNGEVEFIPATSTTGNDLSFVTFSCDANFASVVTRLRGTFNCTDACCENEIVNYSGTITSPAVSYTHLTLPTTPYV